MEIIISNYDSINNPFYGGGGAHAMHELGKRLAVRHNVTIVCGAYRNSINGIIEGVRYVHIGPKSAGSALGQALFSLLLPFKAMRMKFDVWLENFVPPHSTNFISLYTRKPVIGITSILNADKFSQKYHLPFSFIENIGLRTYKHIIAFSDDVGSRVKAKSPKTKVHIIPDGIDSRYLSMKTQEKKYILFIGRIDVYQKGLDLLLLAWKYVTQSHPKMKLVIAGSGPASDIQKVKKLIRTLELGSSVVLKGKVSGTGKEELLRNCLFAVAPSRFETFGIAALELLAFSKPLVSFDIEGFGWIPRSICFKVPQEDTWRFAAVIKKLIEKKALRASISRSAKKFASRYNWDIIALQYEELIADVVGGKL